MSDQKNGNAKENENVIQGPWPKSKRKIKVPDEELLELRENMEFAEELNQDLIIQMVQMMGENGVGVADPAFIRDLGLIIEMTKGSIYRSMGIAHPTHGFSEALVDIDIAEDGDGIHSQVDFEVLEKFIEVFEDDDDPEVS